ncbi:hypothetical protein EVAR_21201_1 [Eumeta japonica]|uniref:Uncharacterized protein n=1 Tax=Eumeta variegata TaxID=151549 RepID=A0A4C1UNQ2_EUMVA|nr:hypothetical protein EVAR_21201_1 [Eumeta japonica]
MGQWNPRLRENMGRKALRSGKGRYHHNTRSSKRLQRKACSRLGADANMRTMASVLVRFFGEKVHIYSLHKFKIKPEYESEYIIGSTNSGVHVRTMTNNVIDPLHLSSFNASKRRYVDGVRRSATARRSPRTDTYTSKLNTRARVTSERAFRAGAFTRPCVRPAGVSASSRWWSSRRYLKKNANIDKSRASNDRLCALCDEPSERGAAGAGSDWKTTRLLFIAANYYARVQSSRPLPLHKNYSKQ